MLFAGMFLCGKAQNRTVKGTILDNEGLPLPGAVVRIKWQADSLATSTSSDGTFAITKVKAREFTLSAAFIGFEIFRKLYKIEKGNTLIIDPIKLAPMSNTLEQVTISGVPPVKVTEDTVSFNAASFPVRDGDAVEEILKKLPGIEVDKDGNVTNQGTPITKIRVNGKDFFGTDVATAISNLPADIIKNLQFIDDYGDEAKLTGIKTGEPSKVLNLTIEEDKKKGYFTRAQGGLGNSERYNTSLRANSMRGERQLAFDGTVNNANTRGSGGDGITTRNAVGMNYRNAWGERLSADASYSFDNSKNNTIASSYTQNFLQDFTRLEDAESNNTSKRYKHDLNSNVEYKIDSMNYLKISPQLTYSSNAGDNSDISSILQQALTTKRTSRNLTDAGSLVFSNRIYYNHRFSKKGRNLGLFSNISYSGGDSFKDAVNEYVISEAGADSLRFQNQITDQDNHTLTINGGFSFRERIWEKSYLETNYSISHSATSSIKDTRDVIDENQVFNPDLSNNFDYQFINHRIGINYRFIDKKMNYTVGLNALPALLQGQNLSKDIETRRRTFNIAPSARFVYNFTKQKSFDFSYFTRNAQPGFLQLQPIADNSNLQNVVTGNPDLKPEFIHSVVAHYKQSDWNEGHILYANASFNQTQDKIVTTKMLVPGTVNQLTSYTNTDGFYNLKGDYFYSKPFFGRKFTIEYSGSAAISNNVAFINSNRNVAKNKVWEQELEFKLDLEDIIDVEFEASYSQNLTTYSQPDFDDRQTNRFQYSVEGRSYFKKFTLGYDFAKTINSGFDNSFVNNPMLLRLYAEYKFMKKDMAAVRLDGFDLFDQNSGISRDVFDNIIVDRQVNRLGRFFMLSLILRMQKFGG